MISDEYARHDNLLEDGVLKPYEKRQYLSIVEGTADATAYTSSLRRLSSYLQRRYGKRTFILIDEYDIPIQEGYLHGYYPQVVSFVRNLFSAALKDNPCLERGVLTGILRRRSAANAVRQ